MVFSSFDSMGKRRIVRPEDDEEIMADPRVVVENVLRERGLLNGSKYAVDQIMREFKPPRIPRPDTKSQLSFIKEEDE